MTATRAPNPRAPKEQDLLPIRNHPASRQTAVQRSHVASAQIWLQAPSEAELQEQVSGPIHDESAQSGFTCLIGIESKGQCLPYLWLDRGFGAVPLMPAMGTHWLLATSKQATKCLSLTRALSELRPPST